ERLALARQVGCSSAGLFMLGAELVPTFFKLFTVSPKLAPLFGDGRLCVGECGAGGIDLRLAFVQFLSFGLEPVALLRELLLVAVEFFSFGGQRGTAGFNIGVPFSQRHDGPLEKRFATTDLFFAP